MESQSTGFYGEIARCLQNYSCKKIENGITAEGSFIFPDRFPAFDGHFPEQPVLPGIIELCAVRYLASACLSCQLVPVAGEHIKFKGLVRPGERIDLKLDLFSRKKGIWENRFYITCNNRKISSGVITFLKS